MVTGKDLKQIRLHANKTTTEMALTAGAKTRKTYENWEHDIGTPNINQFVAMCTSCRVSAPDILLQVNTRESEEEKLIFR